MPSPKDTDPVRQGDDEAGAGPREAGITPEQLDCYGRRAAV